MKRILAGALALTLLGSTAAGTSGSDVPLLLRDTLRVFLQDGSAEECARLALAALEGGALLDADPGYLGIGPITTLA